MNEESQNSADLGQDPVMERVLDTFYGFYDSAGTFISDAATSVGEFGRNFTGDAVGELATDAGEIASSLGETATDVAARVGAAVGDKIDTAVTFATGLLGG